MENSVKKISRFNGVTNSQTLTTWTPTNHPYKIVRKTKPSAFSHFFRPESPSVSSLFVEYSFWLYLDEYPTDTLLTMRILSSPKILHRQLLVVFFRSLLRHVQHPPLDYDLLVRILLTENAQSNSVIGLQILCLRPSLRRVDKDYVSFTINPNWAHIRRTIRHDKREIPKFL